MHLVRRFFLLCAAGKSTKQQEEHDKENRVGDEPEVEGKKEEGEVLSGTMILKLAFV